MQTMQKCKQPPFCPVRPDDIPSEKRKVRNSFEKEEIKQAERKGRCPRRHSPCRFGSICLSRENERNLNAKVWKSPYVRVCVCPKCEKTAGTRCWSPEGTCSFHTFLLCYRLCWEE